MAEGEFAPMLAGRLAAFGVTCHAACGATHILRLSNTLAGLHRLSPFQPDASLEAAIYRVAPSLIIPCDDAARLALNRVHARHAGRSDPAARALCATIEASSGDPRHFAVLEKKSAVTAALAGSNVPTPRSRPVTTDADVGSAVAAFGLPIVLKMDGTCGGQGVAVCRTQPDAAAAYRRLSAAFGSPDGLSAQQYVHGKAANRIVLARQGRVVAGLTVIADITHPPDTGPACVVRVVAHAGITAAVEALVDRFGLSGVHGFDFVLDDATGEAFFIEINARATPSVHLGRSGSSDICRAIAVAGGLVQAAAADVRDAAEPIAIFPAELRRDPSSEHLARGRAFVPWSDPLVVAALVGSQVRPETPSRLWSLSYRVLRFALGLPARGQKRARTAARPTDQPPPNT